jgi:hypothetical protein
MVFVHSHDLANPDLHTDSLETYTYDPTTMQAAPMARAAAAYRPIGTHRPHRVDALGTHRPPPSPQWP